MHRANRTRPSLMHTAYAASRRLTPTRYPFSDGLLERSAEGVDGDLLVTVLGPVDRRRVVLVVAYGRVRTGREESADHPYVASPGRVVQRRVTLVAAVHVEASLDQEI